jgi:hypothetical protein
MAATREDQGATIEPFELCRRMCSPLTWGGRLQHLDVRSASACHVMPDHHGSHFLAVVQPTRQEAMRTAKTLIIMRVDPESVRVR